MKKTAIVLLISMLMSVVLVACGKNDSPNGGSPAKDGDYNWDGKWVGDTVTVTIKDSDNNDFEVNAKTPELNAKLMDAEIKGNTLTGGYGYSYEGENTSTTIIVDFTMIKNGAELEYSSVLTQTIYDESGHEIKKNVNEFKEVLTKIIKQTK